MSVSVWYSVWSIFEGLKEICKHNLYEFYRINMGDLRSYEILGNAVEVIKCF
jgi:hypothetical protein